jgi:hypothetical protein
MSLPFFAGDCEVSFTKLTPMSSRKGLGQRYTPTVDTPAGLTRKGGPAAALWVQCGGEVTVSSLLFSFRCPSAS